MIGKVSNTDVEYWVDRMYRDKPYINKIFESWKPLASDSNIDSQKTANSIIKCTANESIKLKFDINEEDITIATKKTFTIDKIVSVNDSFILIGFYYNFDQNLGESYGKN